MEEQVKIVTDYITLGQFLKLAGVIDTGGMAKVFLQDNRIYVNGELENRRGKKLRANDQINIEGVGTFHITS